MLPPLDVNQFKLTMEQQFLLVKFKQDVQGASREQLEDMLNVCFQNYLVEQNKAKYFCKEFVKVSG